MFVSKDHLHHNLGVDPQIAAFFVNRRVPEGNAYWKGRLLYIARGTGYLFIPLFFDLQFRSGVSIDTLLDEEYVRLTESILHSAALHEFRELSFADHVANCKLIVSGKVKNQQLFHELVTYFGNEPLRPHGQLGTFSPALNRGDSFLFSLTFLDLPAGIADTIIAGWYALVPSFLLMDDIMDLRDDRARGEENSIDDFGPDNTGVIRAIDFLRQKFAWLKRVSPKLGGYFEASLERKLSTPYLQSILTNQISHGTG